MNNKYEKPLSDDQRRDLRVLINFIQLYCEKRHADRERPEFELPREMQAHSRKKFFLCKECAELTSHGIKKRRNCPLDPKPSCRKCRIHCYSGDYRTKIREIMAFSGRRMVMRGRLDYLWHYFF